MDTSRPESSLLAGDDELLTTAEVAVITRVPEGTLRRWRADDIGPPSFRIGPKRVVYRRSALRAWIRQQETGDDAS